MKHILLVIKIKPRSLIHFFYNVLASSQFNVFTMLIFVLNVDGKLFGLIMIVLLWLCLIVDRLEDFNFKHVMDCGHYYFIIFVL